MILINVDCNSKISNFNFSLFGQEDIETLDVAMQNVEFMKILQSFKDLENVQFDEGLWKNGPFAKGSERSPLNVLKNEVDFMIFEDGVEILDNIFVVEVFNEVDFFLDGLDFLLADGHFLHGDEHAVVEVDSLVHQAVGPLSDGLDDLVALNDFVFVLGVHSKFNCVLLYFSKQRTIFRIDKFEQNSILIGYDKFPLYWTNAIIIYNIDLFFQRWCPKSKSEIGSTSSKGTDCSRRSNSNSI